MRAELCRVLESQRRFWPEKHGDEKNKSFTDDEVAAATARAQRLLRTLEHSPIARARLSQRALCPGFLDAVRAASPSSVRLYVDRPLLEVRVHAPCCALI